MVVSTPVGSEREFTEGKYSWSGMVGNRWIAVGLAELSLVLKQALYKKGIQQ